MKNLLHFILVVAMLGGVAFPTHVVASENGKDKKPLVIIPSALKTKVGSTKSFGVKCTVEKNAMVQDQSTWLVYPDSLGQFQGNMFEALSAGKGSIVATYKEFSDTIQLEIKEEAKPDEEKDNKGNGHNEDKDKNNGRKNDFPMITFSEKRISLSLGDSVTLAPEYWIKKDSAIDVDFEFSVDPLILGSISSDQVFTADHIGNGKITASYDSTYAVLRVQVKRPNNKKDETYPNLKIATKRVHIKSGEYVELMAMYADSSGLHSRVSPIWSVSPEYLGHFSDSLFYGDSIGKGYLHATYEGLTDSVPLNVQEPREIDNVWSAFRISITPQDTLIAVGDSVAYTLAVQNKKNWQLEIDSTLLDTVSVDWSVVGKDIGAISEEGLFIATQKGFALIKAKLNGEKALTTRIVVDEAVSDSTGINSVEIQRVLSNGNILPSKTVKEGSSYKIGGLPFPLNILNGGLLHFPVGSLKEDIAIYMMLPEQIREDSTGVELNDSIVAGVSFVVVVGDSIVEPYYFETPLILSIPYKSELLDSLGIDASELGMFFSEDGDYTESGITNIVVDTIQNRIIAEVEHFSSLVVRKSVNITTVVQGEEYIEKIEFFNAPNPFGNETIIRLKVERSVHVQYVIYDITGKLVRNIDMGILTGSSEYSWDATDEGGVPIQSGIYFGQLIVDGKRIGTNKMIKLGL